MIVCMSRCLLLECCSYINNNDSNCCTLLVHKKESSRILNIASARVKMFLHFLRRRRGQTAAKSNSGRWWQGIKTTNVQSWISLVRVSYTTCKGRMDDDIKVCFLKLTTKKNDRMAFDDFSVERYERLR